MAISVVMPALEMAQETGRLLAWRKKEGDRVTKGEPLLEIETDKAVVEIEAPADGILAGVKSLQGAVVPVGETIAWIVAPGEQPPTAPAIPTVSARTTIVQSSPSPVASRPLALPHGPGPRISPKARRLAKEQGVDISRLSGSGPDSTITTEDILAAAKSQATQGSLAPPTVPNVKGLSSVTRLMAERTAQSWTTVPHFFVARDVDASALVEAHQESLVEVEKTRSVRPSLTDFLVLLAARILEKHDSMNSSWTAEGIQLHPEVNVSVAIAVSGGVVAPVIHKANIAKLAEITARRQSLAERARAGRLHPSDIMGGTFTISNLGMYKVDSFMALITPPQAAVLAVGAITDRVVPVNGKPGIRPMMTLTLSSDHRVVDGARAASFLNDVAEAIGEPAKWLR
ncbi:MAG TPA: dihydrolipoamide acetyltransferase family protein [Candidatus Dormibacteraeota bacterium]|nr:dihydrolipoamide acetyltransferase family protein [Candidatus Dormibacteraeota bacterium]